MSSGRWEKSVHEVKKCVKVGKFSKIDNCADWNKDVQAGIFLEINKLCSTIIQETRVHSLHAILLLVGQT